MAEAGMRPQHAVWYQYQIQMNGHVIGSLTNFSPSASQATDRVRCINAAYGTRVQEILAGPTDYKIRAEKVQLFKTPLFQALGYVIYGLEDLKDPIDIVEYEFQFGGDVVERTYHECIMSSYERTITTGTIYIAERCDFEVAYVTGGPATVTTPIRTEAG